MGFRFKKSIKIAPGVKMNFSKRGLSSISAGGFNFGKRGLYHNINIPGTGISYRTKLASKSKASPKQSRTSASKTTEKMAMTLELNEDGSIHFADSKGKPLPDALIREAKKQNRDMIEVWLQEQAANYNAEVEALVMFYTTTPAPTGEIIVNPRPEPPPLQEHGFVAKLWQSSRTKIDEANEALEREYAEALEQWQQAEEALKSDPDVMSTILADALTSLEWPRETLVSFDIVDEGQKVLVDVDLPEIEDLPAQAAAVNKSKLALTIKEINQKQRRLNYLNHIHAIGFRIIGDIFAHLPATSEVVFSGFSQRLNKQTGHIEDQYLYSVRVPREDWQNINFANLDNVDPVACFEQFQIRRKITKTGLISPIDPFTNT